MLGVQPTPDSPYRIESVDGGRRYPSHLQALVDKHAALIGQGFGLTDRLFNNLGHAGLGDIVDKVAVTSIMNGRPPVAVIERLERVGVASAEDAIRVPAAPELEMTARVCMPVRSHDILLGYLWLMDEPSKSLDPVKMTAVRQAASEIGGELYRLRYLERDAHEHERIFLSALVFGQDLAEGVLDEIERRLARASWYVAALAECPERREEARYVETEIGSALGQLRRTRGVGDILAAVVGGRGLMVVALANASDAECQGEAILAAIKPTLNERELPLVVGVGAPVRTVEDLRSSFAQAEQCIRVAKQRGPGGHSVSWTSLGADRSIVALLGERDPRQFIPESVRRLLETEGSGSVLIETLWRYLEMAGDAQAASESMFIHRSTLYHRLHRVEEITGRDLRRGDDRLELHLGWRLSRLVPDSEL